MKRVVIFGSTGPTGLCSLRTTVEKGLEIRVFVRNKAKIPEDLRDKVEAVVGDVTNAKDVAKAVAGRDAVIVVLGTGNNLSSTTVLSQGMRNIVDAMKAHNVELVSVCLSVLLFCLEKKSIVYNDMTEEHQRMLEIIKSSGLKWVAICPAAILDKPKSNYVITINCPAGRAISKYSLGEFLVECFKNPDYYQKIIGIADTS
ncbi:flavin reductase (NADPH) [Solenopsis invicta]|uniref:flavin reductase (NADPH) n=1 Tax=Solenopsis invicta TaxID=13686 RepID=UPI0001FE9959|nr:flavin reductase (NADPH) [Solenopsis invicta]